MLLFILDGISLIARRLLYRLYLSLPHWQRVRRDALRRAGGKCEWCGVGGRLDCHHTTYANLWHEQPDDVVAICRKCHRKAHSMDSESVVIDVWTPQMQLQKLVYVLRSYGADNDTFMSERIDENTQHVRIKITLELVADCD